MQGAGRVPVPPGKDAARRGVLQVIRGFGSTAPDGVGVCVQVLSLSHIQLLRHHGL